jgi:hypothetical protein
LFPDRTARMIECSFSSIRHIRQGFGLAVSKSVGGSGSTRTSNANASVFVSCASQDAAVANAAVEALEGDGVKCWIAPRDVVPGEFYAGAIIHAIDAAKVVVLVLSGNAASSQHVLREVERASSKRHPVIKNPATERHGRRDPAATVASRSRAEARGAK